jgi:hypothetical protein
MKWRVHYDFGDQRAAISYDSEQEARRKSDAYNGSDPQPVKEWGDGDE